MPYEPVKMPSIVFPIDLLSIAECVIASGLAFIAVWVGFEMARPGRSRVLNSQRRRRRW